MDSSIIGTENDVLKQSVESGRYAMKTRCDWNMLDILCNRIEIHKANKGCVPRFASGGSKNCLLVKALDNES